MAEKKLRGINFPGLEGTYMVPEVDNTLSTSGASADAKATGDSIKNLETLVNNSAGVKVANGGEIFNNYTGNKATGLNAHAEGSGTQATGTASHAEGDGAKAIGINSHAEGKGSEAHGADSHAEGRYAKAYGEGSHAEGNNSEAHELFSHAEGYRTRARGVYSHAEGDCAEANGRQSHAEGASTKALGSASHAEGSKTEAHQYGSHAEGGYSKATGGAAHAEGGHYKVFQEDGTYTEMGGGGTLASGNSSHAEGASTIASGNFSHASGYGTKASGEASYAAGTGQQEWSGTCTGDGTTTLTYTSGPSKTLNVGDTLVFKHTGDALKSRERKIVSKLSSTQYELDDDLDSGVTYNVYRLIYNEASGKGARSVGEGTTASGEFSTAEGYKTTAQGSYSHAEGLHSKATVEGAHAEGYQTEATGKYAHSEGRTTKAQGYCSHAEGFGATVSADYGHAEGNTAVASARAAHAEGEQTTAAGQRSHAEGYYTKATADAQHVQGRYNIEDTAKTYAHIVGNGNSTKRSNAHTIDWDGNAWFAGAINVEDKATTLSNIGAAPAGYGLGEESTIRINASNGAVSTQIDAFVANWPNYSAGFAIIADSASGLSIFGNATIYKITIDHIIMKASWANGAMVNLCKHNGVWGLYEWQNPPLIGTNEYRTTDRINNKAVYKRKNSNGIIEYRLDGETVWKTDKAPNPNALTINGITYDGSSPVEVNIASSNGEQLAETDPTVPAWAKAATKPSYSVSEISGAQATINGAASTITSNNLTAGRVLISNDNGKVAIHEITSSELNKLDGVVDNIQSQLNSKEAKGHTHNYAGSSSAGGAATSAAKLTTTTAGSETNPVYFSNGVPVKTTYTLGKSVPSDAKFTDTTYSVVSTSADGLAPKRDGSTTKFLRADGTWAVPPDTKYTLPTASSSQLGGVKTTSTVTSTSGLTACPIISGVPYYKDTNTTYTLPNATSSTLGGVKIGSNITVSSGTISLTDTNIKGALGYTPACYGSATYCATEWTGSMVTNDGDPYVQITNNNARFYIVDIVNGTTDNVNMQSLVFSITPNDLTKSTFIRKLKVIDGNSWRIVQMQYVKSTNKITFSVTQGTGSGTFTITRIVGYV